MNEAEYAPDCPVCGHPGRKQVTTRLSASLLRPDRKHFSVIVFTCRKCRTEFTDPDKIESSSPAAHEEPLTRPAA